MVASVLKTPTMIRVTLLCGRALSERALWLLLIHGGELCRNPVSTAEISREHARGDSVND